MCLDDAIEPRGTRVKVIQVFPALRGKREEEPPRRHKNILR